MYNTFYGLKENPFDITPDSKFLFWSQKHQTAFRHLLYSVQSRKGLILLTGEVGTGKTTLLTALIEFFKEPDAKTRVVYLENSKFSADDLFRYMFNELGLKISTQRKSDFWITLKNFLLECNVKGEKTLLILDESQNYALDFLEEVRLLSNLETSEGKLIQIILAGQPQLMSNINKPELYQLKQRIGISYNLQPLNRDETHLYIQKRLEIAGAKELSIFSQDAIGAVYNYSKGIPRIINILCDNALLFGYATKKNQIGASVIVQVAENMDLAKSDASNAQGYGVLGSTQNESEGIGNDRAEKADDIIIKYAKEHNRKRKSDYESLDDEDANYREFYNERTNGEKRSRRRFAWLAQVALVSITILIIVLLTNDNFFARAENFIQALFHSTSSMQNNLHDAAAGKDATDVFTQQPPQRQVAERQADVSREQMVAPSLQPTITAPAALGETSSQERPAPIARLDEADAKFIVVQTGDTFRDILLQRYGAYNRTIIDRVLKANPTVQDINTILIGQRIALPNL